MEKQEGLVKECRESGLSDRAWCLREGIKPGTFYNWVNRLKQRSGMEAVPMAVPITKRQKETQDVVRIEVIGETEQPEIATKESGTAVAQERIAPSGAVMEIAVGQMRIRLTNEVTPELLSLMLQTLR